LGIFRHRLLVAMVEYRTHMHLTLRGYTVLGQLELRQQLKKLQNQSQLPQSPGSAHMD
jgi:hypothetical protein